MELEKNLKANARRLPPPAVSAGNARAEEAPNGGIEVHVDFTSYINIQPAEMQFTKISCLTET